MSELNRISIDDYRVHNHAGCILILDNIRSAHNVGSIFRTADSFGVQSIHLVGITPPISNRELIKTALGAQMSVPHQTYRTIEESLDALAQGTQIVSVEQVHNSIMLNKFRFDRNKQWAFIFGNEVAGVSDTAIAKSTHCIEIPQIGSKHSINVANSASIVLWEYFRQIQC